MTIDTIEVKVIKYIDGNTGLYEDKIVKEYPLEIIINGEKKYFCMRMPGMDYDLALGLLFSDGIISAVSDVEQYETDENRISLKVKGSAPAGFKKIYSSSGTMFSEELVAPGARIEGGITPEKIFEIQQDFFKLQKVFDKTGGVHASAFYSSGGELISFAEDIGRHNALDKCMGRALASGMAGDIFLVMLSSRLSFEMIRKSYRTGAAVVAGVSAPTSAAVITAEQTGVTLIGFLRGKTFNLYTHPERIFYNRK